MNNDELRPYQEYKKTGLPWVGEVPAHWQTERAKWLYRKMARPVRESDGIVTCFRDGVVTLRKNRRIEGFTNSLKEIGYQGLRRGDLVIHAMDAFAGAVGVSDSDGKSTPVYSVCTARRELDNRYYAYLVREMARSQWILCLARGIRERSTDFRFQAFGAQTVPLPPMEEQRAIADYLDANAVKVRRFIRNRQKLIEVLNEQKQAIISRAVTRGLNAGADLKASRVDWLGDIPAHWNLLPGRVVYREQRTALNRGLKETTVLSLSYGQIVVKPPEKLHGLVPESFETYQLVEQGDIVCRPTDLQNDWKTLRFALSRHQGIITSAYILFHCNQDIVSSEFGHLLLHTYDLKKVFYGLGSGLRQNLRWDDFKYLPCVVPPLNEQDDIVAHVRQETRSIDNPIGQAQREIELMREYRTRLIADIVTGKIDVRHLAPAASRRGAEDVSDKRELLDEEADDRDEDALTGEVAHADD
jgi:type I restriction enzyme, S subunit